VPEKLIVHMPQCFVKVARGRDIVEAERFIALMLREPFDYTEWQRGLYNDVPHE